MNRMIHNQCRKFCLLLFLSDSICLGWPCFTGKWYYLWTSCPVWLGLSIHVYLWIEYKLILKHDSLSQAELDQFTGSTQIRGRIAYDEFNERFRILEQHEFRNTESDYFFGRYYFYKEVGCFHPTVKTLMTCSNTEHAGHVGRLSCTQNDHTNQLTTLLGWWCSSGYLALPIFVVRFMFHLQSSPTWPLQNLV